MSQFTSSAAKQLSVRTRRAYFDCRYGQLHVRTAFPTTGGFDEGVTLFCLHPQDVTSRSFATFLPAIADDRSVYAPDLPGCGESDAAPDGSFGAAAAAVADLAADLRLRQIDVLGYGFGAGVALTLAAANPQLVRRLVLIATPPIDGLPGLKQQSLVLRMRLGPGDDSQWTRGMLFEPTILEVPDDFHTIFRTAPQNWARQIGNFLAPAG